MTKRILSCIIVTLAIASGALMIATTSHNAEAAGSLQQIGPFPPIGAFSPGRYVGPDTPQPTQPFPALFVGDGTAPGSHHVLLEAYPSTSNPGGDLASQVKADVPTCKMYVSPYPCAFPLG